MSRSKFNVSDDKSTRTYDGIVFDSVMEMKYYRDVLCPEVESGSITHFELQKKYELQPKFSRNGKPVKEITYVADFYIQYSDGREEVIDIKGFPDNMAKIKRKMFWYVYPDVDYKWLSYVKKHGGWIEFEKLDAIRKEGKRKKLREDVEDGKK